MAKCCAVRLPSSFPFILSSNYLFYKTAIVGCDFVLAVANGKQRYTPRMVQQQLNRAAEFFALPVVFAANVLHPHDKERFLAAKQALVVPGKLVYLPFASIKEERPKKAYVATRDTLSPIAQLVVLAYLEKHLVAPVTILQTAQFLRVTKPAVQMVFKELEAKGLAVRQRKPNVKGYELIFVEKGRALWELAQPLLTSPIIRTVGLAEKPKIGNHCLVAGVDALATRSSLAEVPPTEFAFPLRGFAARQFDILPVDAAPYQAQLWAYEPDRLRKGEIDTLSLLLSLRSTSDDRVQIQIDQLLKEFPW